jgi:hypothetical protein
MKHEVKFVSSKTVVLTLELRLVMKEESIKNKGKGKAIPVTGHGDP